MAGKTKRQEVQEEASASVPRERASADYEEPRRNVASMPDPVTLETNKARQGVPVRNMRIVLTVGIVLAILAFIVGYFIAI